jgi:predicted CXXCH cytochrome family protein
MKRHTFLTAASVLLLVATGAWGAGSEYIKASAHNFSDLGWSQGEICKPCHTPHNALGNEVSGRLWNHELTNANYTLNASNTATSAGSAAVDMDRVSRLCLSCHDGTVALDSYGGANGSFFASADKRYNLGTDLSNDHPVGNKAIYSYTSGRYKPITLSGTTWKVGTGTAALSLVTTAGGTADATSGQPTAGTTLVVGCYTCHNAHGGGIDGADSPKLLRATNKESALCLTCHYK